MCVRERERERERDEGVKGREGEILYVCLDMCRAERQREREKREERRERDCMCVWNVKGGEARYLCVSYVFSVCVCVAT